MSDEKQSKNDLSTAVFVSREDNPRDVDEAYGAGTYERLFPLCAVAKLGRKCSDDLCHGAGVTLCGFDQDFYDEIVRESEDEFEDEFDDVSGAAGGNRQEPQQ